MMTTNGPLLFLAGLLASAGPARAQVGHDPNNSPYRDLRVVHTISFIGGQLTGGEGKARVGPSNGMMGGIRWDAYVGGAASLFLGVSLATAERNLVNSDDPPETRYFAVVNQDLLLFEGGFNLNLTGRKTWRGLAPYFGASLGLVSGGAVPRDSSGFRFANKFMVGPMVGVRIFPTRRFHLRIEAHDILWKLSYRGTRFFIVPTNDPTGPPLLDPVTNKNSEWVHHPVLRFGIGFTLR